MKKLIFGLAVAFISLFFNLQTVFALPAFPGAVGFGSDTQHIRSGNSLINILKVTNLNDSGTGSLRAAVQGTGNRIVIFDVSGIISLDSHLYIDNPYVYVAGQTSPGGIQLKGAGFKIRTHDVVIRGMLIRPGNDSIGAPLEDRTGVIISNDSNSVPGSPYNIIIDHNSIQWTTDETSSTYKSVNNVTFSNNIMAQPLHCAGHPDGCHGYGPMIGIQGQNVTFYANLLANNRWRNPAIAGSTKSEIINNLVYAWGTGSIMIHSGGEGASLTNIIGNNSIPVSQCSSVGAIYINSADSGTKVYTDDWSSVSGSSTLINSVKSPSLTFIGSNITPMSKQIAYDYVLAKAGALRNDPIDNQIKSNVVNKTLPNNKCNIDSPLEVGGWPILEGTKLPDSDNDGLPDSWDTPNKNPTDFAPSGYTWIEEYTNSFFALEAPPTISPTPFVKQGDANGDNLVNDVDYSIWLANYDKLLQGSSFGDFDSSGKIDGIDYIIWLNNYNK